MDAVQQVKMLRKIQELEFVATELQLFLDTHPDDRQALAKFNNTHKELLKHVRNYEQVYGPLLSFGFSPVMQNHWSWIDSPWPWEINY